MKKPDKFLTIFFLFLFALDFFVWIEVFEGRPSGKTEIHFLNVGQGDSELIIFPNGEKMLIDAGPDKKVTRELDKIMNGTSYIDIAVISHPQLDHFGGFSGLLDRYKFGVFVFNGRSDSPAVGEWQTLVQKIKFSGAPLAAIAAGDSLNYGYGGGKMNFLSPDANFAGSGELNDTGLVGMLEIGGLKALFTSDIGANVEKYLDDKFDLKADILKIAHHGSKFSSSAAFLKKIRPLIGVIEVGKGNTYGHPSKEILERIAHETNSKVFRTDRDGGIKIVYDKGKLEILAEE